jgi:hypothetical protein
MALTKVSFSMITGAMVNVLDYGAKGDGTTNDTAAFQAAAVAANNGIVNGAGPGGTVYVPSGTYLVSRVGLRDTVLIGEDRESTIIKCNANAASPIYFLDAATDRDGTTANTAGGGGFQNLTIDGDNRTNVSGIRTYGGGVVIANMRVTKCATGVALGLPIWANVRNVYSYSNTIGFFTYSGAGDLATSTTFQDCWADTCATTGFYITQLIYSSFINCTSQACGVNGFLVDGNTNGVTSTAALQFIGCANEGGTDIPFLFRKIRDLTVIGPRLISPPSGKDLMQWDDCTGTIIDYGHSGSVSPNYLLSVTNYTAGVGQIKIVGGDVTYDISNAGTTSAIAPVGPNYGRFQNLQTANYTTVFADAGKTILLESGVGAGVTFIIPANSSVAYPVGTEIVFANRSGNNLSISCADTMLLASTFTTGTRTLATQSTAIARKVESTVWIIGSIGGGLT